MPEMNELLVCAGKNGELDSMAGCVRADSMVSTFDGPVDVDSLRVGDKIYTFDGHGLSPEKVTNVAYKGTQPTYLVKTSTREITATANHPFLVIVKEPKFRTPSGRIYWNYNLKWLPLRDIMKQKDRVMLVISKKLPENGSK